MNLPTKTIADIRTLEPCYDPVTGIDDEGQRANDGYLPEDWTGTALDILRVDECPAEHRLWVVSYWLDDRTLRLFAVWCARQALALIENPDPRSMAACNVAERFANGEATPDELATARIAADAAWSAWTASRDAHYSYAAGAAYHITDSGAGHAARKTAWSAPLAAFVADDNDAWISAWDAQIEHLVEMLEKPA